MRAKQAAAARALVIYTMMIWQMLCGWVSTSAPPNAATNHTRQRMQLRHLLGELPAAPADYWVSCQQPQQIIGYFHSMAGKTGACILHLKALVDIHVAGATSHWLLF